MQRSLIVKIAASEQKRKDSPVNKLEAGSNSCQSSKWLALLNRSLDCLVIVRIDALKDGCLDFFLVGVYILPVADHQVDGIILLSLADGTSRLSCHIELNISRLVLY